VNPKAAKLFVNGGSQAVRVPAEFRFEGADEVFVRSGAVTGDAILSARRANNSWREFFALRDEAAATGVVDDFGAERPLNEPLNVRVDL